MSTTTSRRRIITDTARAALAMICLYILVTLGLDLYLIWRDGFAEGRVGRTLWLSGAAAWGACAATCYATARTLYATYLTEPEDNEEAEEEGR